MDENDLTKCLYKDGYCTMRSIIDHRTCDRLREFLSNNLDKDLPFNYIKGHFLVPLPKSAKKLPIKVLFNGTVHAVLEKSLGQNYYLYSYTCNAITVNREQPFHMDYVHFHPLDSIRLFGSPGPPHHIIVNVYLEDTNERNGSFEVVPGSHRWTDFEIGDDGRIDDRFVTHSVRCNLPKGSVIIRDKRTWHRGTRNPSGRPRFMAGFGYSSKWFILNDLEFDADCRPLFDTAPFSTWNIRFAPEDPDGSIPMTRGVSE